MPTREELIAKAQEKFQRQSLIDRATQKYQSEQSQEAAGPSPMESGLRGFAGGAVAGFDDEIGGLVGSAGRLVGIENLGSFKPFDPDSKLEYSDDDLSWDQVKESYRENRDTLRDEQKVDFKVNPGSTITGNIIGSVASPLGKIRAAKISTDAGKIAKTVNAAKTGAMQGGMYGAGMSDADLTKGEYGEFGKDTIVGAGLGGAVPIGVRAGWEGAKLGGRVTKSVGKKMFTSVFGVSEKNASKYLKNAERIKLAPELAVIKSEVDEAVLAIKSRLDDGKISVKDAKEAIKELKQGIRNQLGDAKFEAREALRQTDELFKQSAAKVIQPLKDTKAPTHLANQVVNTVDDLKQGVIKGSKAAKEKLATSKKVGLKPVYDKIDDSIKKLRQGGTKEADSIADDLQAYKDRLIKESGNEIDASLAKVKLQAIDDITIYNPTAGSFDKAKSAAYKGVRKSLDNTLKKQVPEYGKAMVPVAEKSKLLEKASKAYGDEGKAIGKLGQVAGPKGKIERETLSALENQTGQPGAFTRPIDKYTRAQQILKNPKKVDEITRALPEYKDYRQAMARLAKQSRPEWTREQFARRLANSKEARALQKAERKLSEADRAYKPISKLTPQSSESKLKSFLTPQGAPIETVKAMKALEKITGKNYTQLLDDRVVLDSFSKAHTHRSRNVFLFGAIGSIMGGIPGGLSGATFGAAVMDKYGPKIGKSILDGIYKVKSNPKIEVIRSLSVPPAVKKELEREFRVYMVVANAADDNLSKVADNPKKSDRTPNSKGEAKWARDGVKKLGIQDKALAEKLLQSKEGKRLLIEASSLKPGSKRMKKIQEKIKKGYR